MENTSKLPHILPVSVYTLSKNFHHLFQFPDYFLSITAAFQRWKLKNSGIAAISWRNCWKTAGKRSGTLRKLIQAPLRGQLPLSIGAALLMVELTIECNWYWLSIDWVPIMLLGLYSHIMVYIILEKTITHYVDNTQLFTSIKFLGMYTLNISLQVLITVC